HSTAALGTTDRRPDRPAGGTVEVMSAHPSQRPRSSTPRGRSVDPVGALFARQLEVLQAASARLSRAEGTEAVGRAVVEETGRIIDYHNARVYVIEPPDLLV